MTASSSMQRIARLQKPYAVIAFTKSLYAFLNFRRKIFSQYGEDRLLSDLLPERKGRYIDIGAGRPIIGSNTYALYKRGYSGILVEPISLNFRLSRIFRRRDIFLRILAGATSGVETFFEMYPYEYSTTSRQISEKLISSRQAILLYSYQIPVRQVRDFAVSMKPKDPTLISIDAEGADYEVLRSIDWDFTLPRVICVESWEAKGPSLIETLLATKGYILRAKIGLSEIYVHSTYVHLIDKRDEMSDLTNSRDNMGLDS